MTDKIKGNNTGGGGGCGGGCGGRGGGGEIIESTFASGGGGSEPAFHKLLPNIAEAVELLDVATVEEVQQKVEEATSVKYTKSELILGLENGRQLGLFELERQFRINTKYINEELKASKGDLGRITSLLRKKLQDEKQSGGTGRRKRSGRMRTKSFRSRRSKKSTREEEWAPTALQKTDKLKICERCKKKISALTVESNSEAGPGDSESDVSVASEASKTKNTGKRPALRPEVTDSKRKKLSSQEEQKNQQTPQKKSKLLVERNNPLENEPPYCDIFT